MFFSVVGQGLNFTNILFISNQKGELVHLWYFVRNQIELSATLPVLEQKSTATSEQERISTLN